MVAKLIRVLKTETKTSLPDGSTTETPVQSGMVSA